MQNARTRVFSLVLALVMILGLLPGTVSAVETPSFDDFFQNIPATVTNGSGTTAWSIKDVGGEYVLASPSGKSYSTCSITLQFNQDAQLHFEYKISCEKTYDYFVIKYNNTDLATPKNAYSGEVDWTGYDISVQSGDTLILGYYKDGSGSDGDDRAYLRNFSAGDPLMVTFHDGGESYTQSIFGSGTLKKNPFTRDHAVFKGWATEAGGGVVYTDGASITIENDTDLYAVWADAYVVTFENNGTQTQVNVEQNTAIGSLIPASPTRTGYTFGGWLHDGKAITADTVIVSDITYIADWMPITYTIRLNSNGGTGEAVDVSAVYDQEITLPANTFTRSGYSFLGWNTSSYSTSAAYQNSATVRNLQYTQGAVQTLYAIWAGKPVTVYIDLNYETEGRITARICVVGENYNYIYAESTGGKQFSTLADPKREGYNFKGWFTSAEGGQQYTSQTKFADDTPVTLYALWAEAVSITFDANGGTCYTAGKSIDKGTSYGVLPTASRSGYAFDGWYTAAEGGEKVDNTTIFEQNTTLYAHFRPYRYTVKFNANSGEGKMDSVTWDSGVTYTLPKNTFTRDGYIFKEWNTVASPSTWNKGTVYTDEGAYSKTITSSYSDGTTVTFYAQWEEESIFDKALEAIAAAMPTYGIVRSTGDLNLPTVGDRYTISYTSDSEYMDGCVVKQLPISGSVEVIIVATITDSKGSTETHDFHITLYAQAATATETELKNAVAALGSWYKMYPVWGTDTNVNDMLAADLEEKGFSDIDVTVRHVEEVYGNADIAENGDITYFYVNPNTTPSIKMGSYKVTFALSKDDALLVYEDVSVILYWDVTRVKETMSHEILDKVVINIENPLTENLSLPRVVDGKLWTLISWTSSDESVIAISSENQSTADTLFDPYVGIVKQGTDAQTVTLTAAFTFQLTNDVTGNEAPIILYKTFTVIVPPMNLSQAEQVQQSLLEKLEQGFATKGLTDVVTGERLATDENGVYTAIHDIQLPTTRDFGADGKYYPITITSDNEAVIKAPNVNNAARVEVYRPAPDESDGNATITVSIADRDTNIMASKIFTIKVPALTQEEIDTELTLMELVKAAYFEGIRGDNAAKDNVRTDLVPFQEVYKNKNGDLVWIRNYEDRVGYGIVPTPIKGWEDLELWRLFKSSNPNVISHENLLVTRQPEAKAVTITSYLSSETLGRYGELYQQDPVKYARYQDLAGLYYQKVTTDTLTADETAEPMTLSGGSAIVVRGTNNPDSAVPVMQTLDVSFILTGLDGETWIPATSFAGLDESSTVYDVFTRALTDNGYTATREKGTYIVSVSGPQGTLAEKEYGTNSGWMYRVNKNIPDVYMGACPLHDGDRIQVFYTKDASVDDPDWNWPSGGSSGDSSSSGGQTEPDQNQPSGNSPSRKPDQSQPSGNPTGGGTTGLTDQKAEANQKIQVEWNEKAGVYTIGLPQNYIGPQLVTLPDTKAGQLVVMVYPDGSEKVVKKSVLAGEMIKFLLDENAAVKLVDYTNSFSDVADNVWYASAVDFVSGRGLFTGMTADSFAPELPLSRGMLATILYRLEEPDTEYTKDTFSDVPMESWYAQGVAWATETGITVGYGDGGFHPGDNITREQLAVMLYRYAKTLDMNTGGRDSLTGFSDSLFVSNWAWDAMAWAVDAGIISGLPDGTLAPTDTTSRAEGAAMLQRLVEFMLK